MRGCTDHFATSIVFLLFPGTGFPNFTFNFKTAPSPWDSVTLPEEDRVTDIGNMHKRLGKDRAWLRRYPDRRSEQRDRQTERQTDRHIQMCSPEYFAATAAGEVTKLSTRTRLLFR